MTEDRRLIVGSRLRRAAALFVIGASVVFGIWKAPLWSRALTRQGLQRFFGRPALVGSVHFHLLPPSVEILDVLIEGPTKTAPPFLEIPRIDASPALSPLWVGEVALSHLTLERPKIRINATAGGGDDIPRFPRAGPGFLSATVQRLVVEKGEVFLNHERIPLDLDLPGVRGHLQEGRTGTLVGSLAFGPGEARFGTAPPLPIGAAMDVIADGALWTVPAGHVTARGTDLAFSGRLRLGSPLKGDFNLSGGVDLGVLDTHLLATGFDIGGRGNYEGRLDIDGSSFRLDGRLEGRDGTARGVFVPRFQGRVLWQGGSVSIPDLDLEALGGKARLAIDLNHESATLRGHLQSMDLEGLARFVFLIGVASIDAAATGDMDLVWPRGEVSRLTGSVSADFLPRGDERTPVEGRFEWRAENGVQTLRRADLKTPSTWIQTSGRVLLDDTAELALDVQSADLQATDELFARARRALGAADATIAGFGGSGVFRGRWRGTLASPIFEGRFSGKSVSYLGVTWGGAEWAGVATKDAVVSHSLVLHRPTGELWLDGRTETGPLGAHDGLDVRLRFTQWPASDFVGALGLSAKVDGLVTGDAQVRGRRSEAFGSARLKAATGRWYGVPLEGLDLAVELRGAVTEIAAGHATVGGGDVDFKGSVDGAGNYLGEAEAKAVDVADLIPRPSPSATWGGKASLKVTIQGPLRRPKLFARLSSPHLFLGDEGLGALDATLRGEGDGKLALDLHCHSARTEVSVAGQIGAESPYPSDLKVALRDTSLDPLLRELVPAVPSELGIVATGDARVKGPLLSPEELKAEITVPGLEVSLPDFLARSREPVTAQVDGGRLEIKAFHLAGEDTDLTVRGSAALVGDGPLDLTMRGAADLGIIGIASRRLSGRGDASLAVQVGGSRLQPRVEGRLDIQRAGVRVRGFPHGIDDLKGTIHFTQSGAELDGATGNVAGGMVALSGQAAYGSGRKASFDLKASGHSMALRYPEGLRSVVDADLRLFGDESVQWLTGDITVKQALWTKRYDLASELLASSQPTSPRSTLPGNLRLDMKVKVPGTLTIDNNLATLTARADLALQGTDEAPAILGRAEVEHGRVYFQGNTYIIRRGTIDFSNPQRIDPLFDIEADSRVGSYRVTLKVNGTLERVYPTLTSDPPLTALQILNLLAGADEATVTSLQTQTDQTRLAATGAATLAASKISEEVGLESGAEKLLGLSRFSIDPSLIRGTGVNPTARLTLGKRITPDLSVLYSLDLLGSQDRVLSVEYTLSDRLAVVFTSSDEFGLAFDISLRHSR